MAEDKRKHALWWWVDRFRKSTAYTDMTLAEQGAYRNLLDEQRIRGGLIPNDERILAKVCGDALQWPEVRAAVLARFETTADGKHVFNRTATEINAVSDALSATRSEVGRLGYEKVDRGPGGQFTGKATGNPAGNETGKPSGNEAAGPAGKATGSVSVAVSAVRGPLSGSENNDPPVPPAHAGGPPTNGNGHRGPPGPLTKGEQDAVVRRLSGYWRRLARVDPRVEGGLVETPTSFPGDASVRAWKRALRAGRLEERDVRASIAYAVRERLVQLGVPVWDVEPWPPKEIAEGGSE